MRHLATSLLALAVVCVAAAGVRADVKTQEKTKVTFEGMLGRMAGMFGGKAAKDGIVSSVAVKGDRKMTVNDSSGQIIDLAEETIFDLDMKKKTYKVTTFAELRRQMEEARAKAEKEAQEERPEEPQAGEEKEMEVDFDVKETGQTKSIAGHQTREVIITITVREKGKTLEEGGGTVLTTDSWLADRIPELAEVQEFDRRYFEKLAGPVGAGVSAEQMAAVMALYPGMKAAMGRLQKENVNLEGTPLASTVTIEAVKSQAQLAEDKPEAGGSGLGGMLARRMMRKKEEGGARTKVMTTEHEVLSIAKAAADADVAIPAGFKQRTSRTTAVVRPRGQTR